MAKMHAATNVTSIAEATGDSPTSITIGSILNLNPMAPPSGYSPQPGDLFCNAEDSNIYFCNGTLQQVSTEAAWNVLDMTPVAGLVKVTAIQQTAIAAATGAAGLISVLEPNLLTYATWNPAAKGVYISLSAGNLQVNTSGIGQVLGTIGLSSGKWYYDVKVNGTFDANQVIGFALNNTNLGGYTGEDDDSWGCYAQGHCLHSGAFIGSGFTSYAVGDVIGVAINADASSVQFYKNGVANGSAISYTGTIYPAMGSGGNAMDGLANFGASAFAYMPPAGYHAGVYTSTAIPGVYYIQMNDTNVISWADTADNVMTESGQAPTQGAVYSLTFDGTNWSIAYVGIYLDQSNNVIPYNTLQQAFDQGGNGLTLALAGSIRYRLQSDLLKICVSGLNIIPNTGNYDLIYFSKVVPQSWFNAFTGTTCGLNVNNSAVGAINYNHSAQFTLYAISSSGAAQLSTVGSNVMVGGTLEVYWPNS